MDLKKVQARLENLNKNSNTNDDDGVKVKYFKPQIGKQTIRIVPSKFDKEMPFTEVPLYFEFDGKPFPSPVFYGKKDPIVEFCKQLFDTHTSENWKLARKLEAKIRIFAPIIERGKEDDGVKLWQFGKLIYQDFLNLANDEEVGDFTDVLEGRDIKLTTVGPDVTGTVYNKTTISPSMKTSPLSTDSKLVEAWLDDQPDPKDSNKAITYDEIKEKLRNMISPEDDEIDESKIDNKVEAHNAIISKNPKSKEDEFDFVFKGEANGEKKEEDDLPF